MHGVCACCCTGAATYIFTMSSARACKVFENFQEFPSRLVFFPFSYTIVCAVCPAAGIDADSIVICEERKKIRKKERTIEREERKVKREKKEGKELEGTNAKKRKKEQIV